MEGVLEYTLNLNYSLHILPHKEEYFYLTSVVANAMVVCKWFKIIIYFFYNLVFLLSCP